MSTTTDHDTCPSAATPSLGRRIASTAASAIETTPMLRLKPITSTTITASATSVAIW